MPKLRIVFLTLSLLSITGCAILGLNPDLLDRNAFVKAKTYSWKSPEIKKKSGVFDKQYQLDQKVRADVNKLMNLKGYQLSEPPTDLYTDYDYKIIPVNVAEQAENAEASISFSKSSGINTSRVNEGSSSISLSAELSILIYDRTKKKLAYSSKASNLDVEQQEMTGAIQSLIRKAQRSIPKVPE